MKMTKCQINVWTCPSLTNQIFNEKLPNIEMIWKRKKPQSGQWEKYINYTNCYKKSLVQMLWEFRWGER